MGNIFEKIQDIFTGGNRDENVTDQPIDQEQGILPASQDPLGDPADTAGPYGQQFPGQQPDDMTDGEEGILPASQDPLGDPADQEGGDGILPASMDPLGDPADDQYARRP